MVSNKLAVAILLSAGAYSCVASPDRITPKEVALVAYLPLTCQQLAVERDQTQSSLNYAEREQRAWHHRDGTAASAAGSPIERAADGNREDKIAQLKGNALAINSVSRNHGCTEYEM